MSLKGVTGQGGGGYRGNIPGGAMVCEGVVLVDEEEKGAGQSPPVQPREC